MIGSLTIEHGIPMPPPPTPRDPNECVFCGERPRVEPYRTCDECRAWAKGVAATRKAQGLCVCSPCPNPPKPGKTMCAEHLQKMLDYVNERREERKKAKVCIDCGERPQWFGLRCVICRSRCVKDGSLPIGAIKAIKKYRRDEVITSRRMVAIQTSGLLDGRAREVIRLRHGLVDGYDWSLEEIGQHFGCTRERIRQIEERVYDDLSTTNLNLSLLRWPYLQKRRPTPAKVSEYESKKRKAHQIVARAIADGRLTRQPCQECGDKDSLAHHHKGYDLPLEVEWVCRHHHMIVHGRNKSGQYTPNARLKPSQPAKWLLDLGTNQEPRVAAIVERMKAFRPRLKQKQIVEASGFKYQPLMNVLRGFSSDEAVINFLNIYMTRMEAHRKQHSIAGR